MFFHKCCCMYSDFSDVGSFNKFLAQSCHSLQLLLFLNVLEFSPVSSPFFSKVFHKWTLILYWIYSMKLYTLKLSLTFLCLYFASEKEALILLKCLSVKAVIYMIKFMVSGMLKTEVSETTDKYSRVFFKYFGFYLIYLIYFLQCLKSNCLIEYVPIIFFLSQPKVFINFNAIWLCYAHTIDVNLLKMAFLVKT